jgi:hypothetical protein
MRPRRRWTVFCVVVGLSLLASAPAGAVTLWNPAAITVRIGSRNDDRAASPYPSTLPVSGLRGSISDLNVILHDVRHDYPSDIHVLLVAPSGTNLVVLADAGGDTPIHGLSIILDDEAETELPESFPPTGTVSHRPGDRFVIDALYPPPAPSASSASALSVFDGENPNGTWSLYVADDVPVEDAGSITGGWSLDMTLASPDCSRPTHRGSARNDVLIGGPGDDVIDAGTGSDVIHGLAGDDVVCAGDGTDRLEGGAGNDVLLGGAGNDLLLGGPDDDALEGGPGRDSCHGDHGSDDSSDCERSDSIPVTGRLLGLRPGQPR